MHSKRRHRFARLVLAFPLLVGTAVAQTFPTKPIRWIIPYPAGGAGDLIAAKTFQGEKPADLPFQQPTELDLTISLRAAKALGITIPQSVLVRATRLIE